MIPNAIQWINSSYHHWRLSCSLPDDCVNAYVYSSNLQLDTNINYISYKISLSKNEANHSVANQSCIDVCLWKAERTENKLHSFSSFVYTLNYQIIAITETWLTSSIYDDEIPATFSIYVQFIIAIENPEAMEL